MNRWTLIIVQPSRQIPSTVVSETLRLSQIESMLKDIWLKANPTIGLIQQQLEKNVQRREEEPASKAVKSEFEWFWTDRKLKERDSYWHDRPAKTTVNK